MRGCSARLKRRDRVEDLIRRRDCSGVVGDIDVESGAHLYIRIIRGRVSYRRDVVAELSGIANRRLHARVRDEPDDDELVNAVLFELQIEIGVGKAAGTPMLQ